MARVGLNGGASPGYPSRVDDEQTKAWLTLSLCSNGRPDLWLALAAACGGALSAVTASDRVLRDHRASPEAIRALREAWPERSARVLERCRGLGIRVSSPGTAGYPDALLHIPDPPLVLFWRGAEPATCVPGIAIVGARACSDYGLRTARRIAAEAAAAGVVVISGLARGIDGAAHRGALERGRTAAVLAGGLDSIYPGEHRELAERIADSGGCVMSEQPPDARPRGWLFPFRNRLITGLSQATIVVEAKLRSGSLASARHALAQGRDVFAVPGPIDSPLSAGTNRLLSQGAATFCETADLASVAGLERFGEKDWSKRKIDLASLPPDQGLILSMLMRETATADEVSAATALDGTRVLALLTALELDGLIQRGDHGRFRALACSL